MHLKGIILQNKQQTVTRGEVGKHNGRKREEGHQGTCIKDTWTKPKRGRIEGGRWGWVARGRVVGGKLYLNKSKKIKRTN